MTREEVITILGIIKTAYPRFYSNLTKDEAEQTISLWHDMFADSTIDVVKVAVKNLINTLEFPPTIADIKNEIYKLYNSREKQDSELWNELKDALRNGIYYSAEIFPKLSKELQLFLGNPASLKELAMMDIDEVDTVQKGIFLKQMPIIKKREQERRMMLPESKKLLESLANNLSIQKYIGE